MVFSSVAFIFFFLPFTLIAYLSAFCVSRFAGNSILLLASLFFYFWGERQYVIVLIASVSSNYFFALGLGYIRNTQPRLETAFLFLAIILNLLPLAYFKYGNFLLDSAGPALAALGYRVPRLQLHLPLGISFFTFQAISYLVDVYRREIEPQRNLVDMSLFMAIFPHQIAGPIVRYVHIAEQIRSRSIDFNEFTLGVFRFTAGLGKKVLLANPLGQVADNIFQINPDQLSQPACWLGVLAYTFQIYFDFSGYSDMAIGLAKMIGLDFHENFNFPYLARSVQDFWRRWHISLSSWFRDYLYIPLGGNRKGAIRTNLNLLLVFSLCGLWHGASWSFVVWGLWHGLFLVLERTRWSELLAALPSALRTGYALTVVVVGWVFFRSHTLAYAVAFLQHLFLSGGTAPTVGWVDFVNAKVLSAFILGLIFCHPKLPRRIFGWFHLPVREDYDGVFHSDSPAILAQLASALVIFMLASVSLAAGTYNPFIYFRF